MEQFNMLNNKKLTVSDKPPFDPLQAFVRENHIALEGAKSGKLSDLVFAAKDVFKILGSTYSNGHPTWLQTHGPDDFTADQIQKLLDQGADLVGKTVCDELCYSISGENWQYGSPLNPHDPRRFTGGSSSGSAAATAGGLVDFALGSDCLGSVRVPASYNGVLGMRPTYQRIDNNGEAPYCKSMDVLGYVAQEPEVFERVSEVLLGEDPENRGFEKLIIASDCLDCIDSDVKEAIEPAVKFISKYFRQTDSAKVSDTSLEEWVHAFRHVQGYEVWESYGGWIRKYKPTLSQGPKERLEWASTITRNQYTEALERKESISKYFNEWIGDNVIVLPTTSSVALLKSESADVINKTRAQSSNLLCISPLTGTPQITIPLVKQHGVPLGITLISRMHSDMQLIRLAVKILSDFLKENPNF